MKTKLMLLLVVAFLSLALTLSACEPGIATPTQQATSVPTVPTSTPVAPTSTPVAPSPTPAPPTPTPAATTAPTAGPIVRLTAGQAVTITHIHMLDVGAGWAIGSGVNEDHILRTDDGGRSWRDVTPPEPASAGQKETKQATGFFLDPDAAWIVYGTGPTAPPAPPTVWRTGDGGQSWKPSQPLETSDAAFFTPSDMQFIDAQNGWLLVHVDQGMMHDYVTIFKTADGGVSWQCILQPDAPVAQDADVQPCSKTGLFFASAQVGWLTGDCNGVAPGVFLYQTGDGGHTWQSQELPPPADAPDLFAGTGADPVACGTYSPIFFTPQAGALVVQCKTLDAQSTPSYLLYTTADAGKTWHPHALPAGSLEFISADIGWALGPDLYQTRDGGQTWTKIAAIKWEGQLDFVTDQLGWAVTRPEDGAALLHTTDGGRTWAQLHPQTADASPTVGPSPTPIAASRLIVTPAAQTFPAGSSVQLHAKLDPPPQATDLSFQVQGLPAGVTAEWLDQPVPYEGTVTLTTAGSLASGSYTATVLVGDGVSLSLSASITLHVTSCTQSQSGEFTQTVQSNLVELITAGKPAVEHGLLVPIQICGSDQAKRLKVTLSAVRSEAGTVMTAPPRFYLYRSLVWPAPNSIQAHMPSQSNVKSPRVDSVDWQLEGEVAPGLYLLVFERDHYGSSSDPKDIPATVTYRLESMP